MTSPARLKRLYNDYEQMKAMHERRGLIYMIAANGNPPEHYVIGFHCRGVTEIGADDRPSLCNNHRIELILTAEYPRIRPLMHWMTRIFHPNFNEQGAVCIKEWYPQQTLSELCVVLAEMVQYKNYNTTSPLNMEAALWAMRHRDELPIDDRGLFASTSGQIAPPAPAQSLYQPVVVVTGTLPIWSPAQETASARKAARFCENCGFEFRDATLRTCPRCDTQRGVI